MKKKVLAGLLVASMTATMFAGCGSEKPAETTDTPAVETEQASDDAEAEAPVEEAPVEEVVAGDIPEAFAHLTFDEGAGESYKAVVQTDNVGDNDGANFGLEEKDVNFTYTAGPVGQSLFLDGSYGLDLGLEATNTDAYTVSLWIAADRLATFGPTLQMGYNMGKSDAANDVTWMNVTQSEWGEDNAKIFPIVWSRNVASNAADGTVCWPWMYAFDNEIHGKKEWVMVTIVASGEEQAGPTGATTVGAQYYINGQLVYNSQDNYENGTYFEYTWDATLAPNIMKPSNGAAFESLFGINYWDTVFKGCVDDLYVFDSALDAGQVLALYNLGDASVAYEAPEVAESAEEETAEGESTGYAEYAVVRADNFGWGAGYDDIATASIDFDFDAEKFAEVMDGAKVELSITNNGETADVKAVYTCEDGRTINQTYTGIAITGDLYYCLSCEASYLELEDGATVGATDCTTAWWTEFSDIKPIASGETATTSFTVHTDKGDNWHNFVVILQNVPEGHAA